MTGQTDTVVRKRRALIAVGVLLLALCAGGAYIALIDAAAPKAKAGSYDLAPTGAAGATLNLKAQGDAKNVKEDIAKDKTVATITWTFAAGNAAGGISVDDSWEGNHEMGID